MSEHATHDEHPGGHVLPLKMYYGVYGTLLVLTVLTVAVSHVNLGSISLLVAMIVAGIKAFFVAAFFMHLKYEDRFHLFVFMGSFLFLLLLGAFTHADLAYRTNIEQVEGNYVFYKNKQHTVEIDRAKNAPVPVETEKAAKH